MAALGVPIIPGSGVLKDAQEAEKAAEQIGYPLLIKAKAGGGGRGIRKVTEASALIHEFDAAVREAEAYFGDGAVYMEKYLNPVNHVEMQVLCDQFGKALCLGDRECSIQRKNQKMLEESPSLTLNDLMREEISKLCIKAMEGLNYTGLGTMEFLCTQDGQYYFMEMNTRLQVEHPVTEMVTGIDLVKWQLRVAAGLPLNFSQEDINVPGCAIECRQNTENPAL